MKGRPGGGYQCGFNYFRDESKTRNGAMVYRGSLKWARVIHSAS